MKLYPILDTAVLEQHGICLPDAVSMTSDIEWVQIRHKGPFDRVFLKQLEACAQIKSDLILNDRADCAALFGFGLHVGQEDLPPSAVRGLVRRPAILGLSTHNEEQLLAGLAEPVDYLALGPIFPTHSKANPDPVVGLEKLAELRRLTDTPLVAIGGITLDNAWRVISAGAEKIAVISALWQPPYTLKAFRDNIERWQQTLAIPI